MPLYKKLYPELLKRLDDANDGIRLKAIDSFGRFFTSYTQWRRDMTAIRAALDPTGQALTVLDAEGHLVELGLEQGHFETIIKGLTLHMDDANRNIQVLFIYLGSCCFGLENWLEWVLGSLPFGTTL